MADATRSSGMLTYLRNHHAGLLALFVALSGTSYAVATGSIDGREIRNNSVTSRDLRTNSVLGRDLRNGRVSGADLRDGSVSGADLRDAGVSAADLADNSVGAAELADNGVGGAEVRNNSLGDADIGGNAISADEIRAGSVRTEEVLNGTLRAEDFAAGVMATDATVRFDDFAVAGSAAGSEDVACGAGERALGGGVSFGGAENGGDRVTFSEPRAGTEEPAAQGATATAWAGGIVNGDPAAERTARVWVVCASR
jgi:hypothetical protein